MVVKVIFIRPRSVYPADYKMAIIMFSISMNFLGVLEETVSVP